MRCTRMRVLRAAFDVGPHEVRAPADDNGKSRVVRSVIVYEAEDGDHVSNVRN